jgi:hypothetical protein
VASRTSEIVLSMEDLREVTGYAAESAQEVLEIFERAYPSDLRPREAIDAAWTFARGGKRGKTLRDAAWASHKAAQDAVNAAAGRRGEGGNVRGIRRVLASTGQCPSGEAHSRSGGARGESGRTRCERQSGGRR